VSEQLHRSVVRLGILDTTQPTRRHFTQTEARFSWWVAAILAGCFSVLVYETILFLPWLTR